MMASYGQHHLASSRAAPPRQAQHHHHGAAVVPPAAASVMPGPAAPAGTFQPGTKIQVGSHRVVIVKYLSEGGFAHVYVVRLPQPVNGTDQAVLKRVAVPDKEALRGMRTEVETMKRLKGHRMIVTYIDSHASEMRGGGYEVFLLMEYCSGGGLIDFMNTRLQHRLTEPEILNIFCDIAEGVACMHYLKPPLLHRDLKIENVLITSGSSGSSRATGSTKRFKLCDFGSSAPPTPAPTSVAECRLMDEDVQKHTTLQYRSPEMVDVYRKQPLNEKADIWALGVFLYKLCYYTTPFEDQGQLAILNASYRFPSQPLFSDRLKRLIASMLKENPGSRPNIYQVVKEACTMQGRDVPIRDIYSGAAAPSSKPLPKAPAAAPVGATFSRPVEEKETIPDVTPMRRGRPAPSPARPAAASPAPRPVSHQPPPKVSGLPPSSSSSGDPFAALDSRSPVPGNTNTDEFSSRFPSLDQFSLLHDQGSKFEFESTTPTSARPKDDGSSSDPNLHRMADEAFASSRSPPVASAAPQRPQSVTPSAAPVSAPKMTPRPIESLPRTASGPVKSAEISRAQSIISSNPDLKNISTQKLSNYVSTGTSTSDLPLDPPLKVSQRISQIQATASARQLPSPTPSEQSTSASAPNLSRRQEQEPDDATPPPSVSARVSSFESPIPTHTRSSSASRNSIPRRTEEDLLDIAPARSARQRPQSTALEPTSTMDYLREREASSRPQSRLATTREAESRESTSPLPWANLVPTNDESPPPAAEPTNVDLLSGPEEPQRPVEPAVTSSSSPKSPVSSNFGDAFKRFEGGRPSQVRSPSPLKHQSATPRDPEPPVARPVPAPTDKDPEEMTPEQRREMERIMLLEEEQRVEAAQAEYRKRVAAGGAGASGGAPVPQRSSSTSIQSRVQGLMAERQTNVPRTAHGYGKYSDAEKALPEVPRKPVGASGAPPSVPPKPSAAGKPVAPKKPARLNSLPTGASGTSVPPGPAKRSQPQEQLVAVDLPGQPALDMTAAERDSYLEDFSARFPSLSSMEGKS